MNSFEPDPLQPVCREAMLPNLALPYTRKFGLMAETLEVHSNYSAVLDICTQAFGRYPLEQTRKNESLQIDIIVGDNPGSIIAASDPPEPRFYYHAGWFAIQVGSQGFATSDLATGKALAVISPALLRFEAYIRYHIVEALGLAMLGLARNYFVLHAACVEKNGQGIIILADSGTGKSSLAYSCLRHGFYLVTEDSLQVKVLPDGDYALYGTPWKLHLLPDARQLFPELAQTPQLAQINGGSKLEIDVEMQFPGMARTTTHPVALVFLERAEINTPLSTHLSELPAHIARQRLRVIWSWDIGWDERHEQAIQNLLNLPAYRLAMNGSPDEAVFALDEILNG